MRTYGRMIRIRAGLPALLVWLLWCSPLTACDWKLQEVRIAAQDYRFMPPVVRLSSERPIRFTVVNEGRETHEFTATFLSDRSVTIQDLTAPAGPLPGPAYRLAPGTALRVTFEARRGTYSFACRVRGHHGMAGTLILE